MELQYQNGRNCQIGDYKIGVSQGNIAYLKSFDDVLLIYYIKST